MDPASSFEDVIENIDIGGPAMLQQRGQELRPRRRRHRSGAVRRHRRRVECQCRRAVGEDPLRPGRRRVQQRRLLRRLHQQLPVGEAGRRQPCAVLRAGQWQFRQGDGPALRREPGTSRRRSTATCGRRPVRWRRSPSWGKELSYNNIADSDATWECVRQFDVPACVIVKHANPAAWRSAPVAPMPMKPPTPPTRPARSAASSPSTPGWMRRPEGDPRPPVRRGADRAGLRGWRARLRAQKANVRVLRIPMAKPSPGFIDTKRVGPAC